LDDLILFRFQLVLVGDMLPLATAALICHDAAGSDTVDADNSSCSLALGFTRTSRTKARSHVPGESPGTESGTNTTFTPTTNPVAGVTKSFMTPQLTDPVAKGLLDY